jgi:hypothetical protein
MSTVRNAAGDGQAVTFAPPLNWRAAFGFGHVSMFLQVAVPHVQRILDVMSPDRADGSSGRDSRTETQPLAIRAVDVRAVSAEISWLDVANGILVEQLPTCTIPLPPVPDGGVAVLSWRWDQHAGPGRSRNVALAIRYARDAGIRYLLLDLVSIDQTLAKPALLRSVVDLANLYASIPVIAAYDMEPVSPDGWSRTLQRPWILSEIRAYCRNPTSVTHVGFCEGPRQLSFANEVSVIRSRGYAGCIFEILSGRAEMFDVEDFIEILAEFSDPVAACYSALPREDYLMAVFLLTALYERHQTVSRLEGEEDYGFRLDVDQPGFEHLGLTHFSLGDYLDTSAPFESARPILLDGRPVAIWRSKMTSSYDRNWIEVQPNAERHIFDVVRLGDRERHAYWNRAGMRTAFLQIIRDDPRPRITERVASLGLESWLSSPPAPGGSTLGFDPDLWQ